MSIHVVEELLDALEEGTDTDTASLEESVEAETVMAIGDVSTQVQEKRKTMRLSGCVQGLDIMILVDSGSVGSFISTSVADKLKSQLQTCQDAQHRTADGSPMTCSHRIPNLAWSTQSHTFHSSMGVLPLKCYDMILGEDWLESCSPMWVHWTKKIMRFVHKGR